MAAVSTQSSPHGSPSLSSPSMKGLKKVLSNKRRSSEAQSEGNGFRRPESVDSLSIDHNSDRSGRSSPSRESQHNGYKKLLPGHSKRERRRVREEQLRAAVEDVERGRTRSEPQLPVPDMSRRASTVGDSSLLTDDSEQENPMRPELNTHDSHVGLLTHTSPLVKTETLAEINDAAYTLNHAATVPSLVEPPHIDESPSPKSPANSSMPTLPMPGLIDKADTLRPEKRSDTFGRLRGKSPARKFRDVFSKGNKSPRVSPERKGEAVNGVNSPLSRSSTVGLGLTEEDTGKTEEEPLPFSTSRTMPILDTKTRPATPPTGMIVAPETTVTPPTPTDTRFSESNDDRGSVRSDRDESDLKVNPNITVSPSGNMISHRRVRSASSASREPSKLSNSIVPPLTPTIEEVKTPSGTIIAGSRNSSGSFFTSWMSAAQNAASTFTNLTGQNRSRAGTTTSDPLGSQSVNGAIKEEPEAADEEPRKKLAVETMGSGDLNFEHLGLDDEKAGSIRSGAADLRDNPSLQRDMAAAIAEDVLAKRAVSAAYENPEPTPVAELPDPVSQMQSAKTVATSLGGEHTPPGGSIYEGETTSIRRTNSVRSRLANRRSRGSSVATGQSAIGAMIGASTAALANPASGPRLSGFAVAPKQRNRTFHQSFRSVPEDDYLIEDYSCALQKEILLAGRIYISEGHICFSSNILGWVTTVVISFDEVVSIERENTALVIPNAIAIQTLHARHTFRSLLSREATYELLIGIWKVSHPASFQKSQAGKEVIAEEATKDATGTGPNDEKSGEGEDSDDEESDGSEDDEDDAPSFVGSSASQVGSDRGDGKTVSRKPSGLNGAAVIAPPTASVNDAAPAGDASAALEAAQDFPGPIAHAPTECNDGSTHYDMILKDEVIQAPLGKIYSLLYGPQSGVFMRKFLVDECKSMDLALEDDKKGLGAEKTSRQYTYIKPLGGSIGPKQTKTVTTEELDFYDLQKAVSVTCTTQTPDVPSGGAFVCKTRYCLTWAAGNQTRLQMNFVIEWSAKSWLKGPIEKGAKDGQQQYGDSLVKSLKAAVGRPRGLTSTSKTAKKGKKRKSEKVRKSDEVAATAQKDENWGLLEPLRGPLGPVVDLARPLLKTEMLIAVLFFMVIMLWVRGSPARGDLGIARSERLAAYEEMWRTEESQLWDWLESRANVDAITYQKGASAIDNDRAAQSQKQKQRQKVLKGKDVASKLREEKMAEKEVEEAIRVTRERLEVLEDVVREKKAREQTG